MSHGPQNMPVARSLSELLAGYLRCRADSGSAILESGEVVLFEAAPAHPVEPRVAWEEAIAAAQHYDSASEAAAWKAAPEWPTLVATHEPVMALPFCLGNFPQLVRDLHGLLKAGTLSSLRPMPARPADAGCWEAIAQDAIRNRQHGCFLLASGVLRLANHCVAAERLLHEHERDLPSCWRAGYANERAALAWHRGQADEARALWAAQEPSVPVLFNRGMAALFSDDIGAAREALVLAVAQLPEDSAWHHLGRLYLALAAIHS